jgi:hypothetical protein
MWTARHAAVVATSLKQAAERFQIRIRACLQAYRRWLERRTPHSSKLFGSVLRSLELLTESRELLLHISNFSSQLFYFIFEVRDAVVAG